MRLLGKILFVLFALSLLLSGATLAYFKSWRASRIQDLQRDSQIIETATGKVEFAEKGKGPAVLILHGAPGGYDQGLLLGEDISENGFRILAPSRPGYLRTTLGATLTPEEQADAMVAFLDALGIKQVAVLAFSMGAPEAIHLVVRHPDRVWGVVLVSPIVEKYQIQYEGTPGLLSSIIGSKGYSDIASWLLLEEVKHFPERTLRRMLSRESAMQESQREKLAEYILHNPQQLESFRHLVASTIPMNIRQPGFTNDTVQIKDFPSLENAPMQIPFLAIYGDKDADTSASKAKGLVKFFPKLENFVVKDTGHIVWLGPNAQSVKEKILSFLRASAPPAP